MNMNFWGPIAAVGFCIYLLFFPYFAAFRLLMWSGTIIKALVKVLEHLIRGIAWVSVRLYRLALWTNDKSKKYKEEHELRKVRRKFSRTEGEKDTFDDSLNF